jgi:hypothetical protein
MTNEAGAVVRGLGGIGVGAIVFGASALAMRMEELQGVLAVIRKRRIARQD